MDFVIGNRLRHRDGTLGNIRGGQLTPAVDDANVRDQQMKCGVFLRHHVDPLFVADEVARAKYRSQLLGDGGEHHGVDAGADSRVFQIRVHAGERRRHKASTDEYITSEGSPHNLLHQPQLTRYSRDSGLYATPPPRSAIFTPNISAL